MADGLNFDEDAEESWIEYLNDFDREVWPVLRDRGYTNKDIAFVIWLLNKQYNLLTEIADKLEERV